MQKYHDTVQDVEGNGVTTASIYVYLAGTTTLAAIKKDDETTVLSNPITSADTDNYDSKGNFGYKAANGIYDIKVVASDTTWRTERVLFDNADNVVFGSNVSLGSNNHLYIGANNDLDLFHDTTDSRIDNNFGSLIFREQVNSGNIDFSTYDSTGAIKLVARLGGTTPKASLYYNAIEEFRTGSGYFQTPNYLGTGSGAGVRVNSNGRVDYETNTTGAANVAYFLNNNGIVGSIVTNGTTTAYNTTSDKRLKTSHGLVNNASLLLNQIEIHNYHFNTDDSLELQGVMAQDVYEIYPNAVSKPEDEEDVWAVDYSKFVPLMLANIQELNKQIEGLKNE